MLSLGQGLVRGLFVPLRVLYFGVRIESRRVLDGLCERDVYHVE